MSDTALGGLRVLELAGPMAALAGKLLGDLGADVVKMEPPGGDVQRRRGAYAGGIPHQEGSLAFFAMNTNKRGVTLDLESTDGRLLFRALARRADAVIEASPPGWMDEREIGYDACSKENPGLIWASVTPYGQTGPHSRYKGTDISGQAMGGPMFLTGDPERPPVRGGGSVAYRMTGYTAATAIMFAIYQRGTTGLGQFIDVSMQEAVAWQMESVSPYYGYQGIVHGRGGRVYALSYPAALYPCRDGWISMVAGTIQQWTALIEWMGDERLHDERFRDISVRHRERLYLDEIICEWTRAQAKADLFHEGQRRRIPVGICSTPAEVVRDEHLRSGGYFGEVEHAYLGKVEVPGNALRMSRTPGSLRRPAPLLGEHNLEVYGEVGFSGEDVAELRRRGVI